MTRILLVTDCFDPQTGGVQRVVRDLAAELLARDHRVEVVSRHVEGAPAEETLDGLPVHRLRLGLPAFSPRAVLGFPRRWPPAALRLRRILGDFRPDVVHLHFLLSPLTWLLLPVNRGRAPLVATAHGRDVGSMADESALGAKIVRSALRRARVVTAPSTATLEASRARAGETEGREWMVVPNMLPSDLAGLLDRPAASGDGGVLAVGELHPKKGFDLLVRAVASLDGVRLRIAGAGEQRDELLRLASDLGAGDRVELPGFVPRERLREMLGEASLLAVPSRREPFGLVILEGFAAGLPVVAARTDGVPEVVGPSGAALLVEPEDPDALAAAIRRVLSDSELRRSLAGKGRERAREFSAARMADGYLRAYRLAMEQTT